MPCCKADSVNVDGWCKDHPIVYTDEERKEYCVFHAPKEHKKSHTTGQRLSVEEFNALVYEEIERSKRANNKCNLSWTIFPGDISFKEYKKDNPLPAASFSFARFSSDANFREALFSGETDFSYATFNGVANIFWLATFSGEANFEFAKFSGEAIFTEATFGSSANFREAEFSGVVDFRSAKFSGIADFWFAKFIGTANFCRATFSGDAIFDFATFNSRVHFDEVTFKKATFTGTTFSDAEFVNLTYINTKESISFTSVCMRKPLFLNSDLSKFAFISCQWDEKDGRYILCDETRLLEEELKHYSVSRPFRGYKIIRGRIKRLLLADFHPFDTRKIGMVEDLYRQLKVKYQDMYNEAEVAKWNASEKEMQRKKASIIRNTFDWFMLNIYRSLCGYGENPKRAFLVLVFSLLIFSGLLAWAGLATTNETPVRTIEISTLVEKFTPRTLYELILCTLQNVTFERAPNFTPKTILGYYLIIIMKLFVPIQATLLIFALRNRFRR